MTGRAMHAYGGQCWRRDRIVKQTRPVAEYFAWAWAPINLVCLPAAVIGNILAAKANLNHTFPTGRHVYWKSQFKLDVSVMPEPLRLALVSDIHHGEDKLTKRGSAALGLLDDFFAFAGGWGADMIVDLGDRISDIDKATDTRLLADVAAKFVGLNTPHAHINGNHDVAFLGEEANAQALNQASGSYAIELKGWRLIFWQADAFIPYPEPFSIRRSDLDWLEAELRKSDAPTIVFNHVPLSTGSMVGNYWFQNNPEHSGYPNAGEARAVIEQNGHVVLCVSGHVHWNSLNRINAIPYVTIQSLTESFTTSGEPSGAWATLEISDVIRWQTHGADPIEVSLPVRSPQETWPEPLSGMRHRKRAWKEAAPLGDIEALVFDLDGVLYRDAQAIEHAREFVSWAQAKGLAIAAVTNNAGRSAGDYATKLNSLGYRIGVDQVLSAGMATARWLAERSISAKVYVVGPEALKAELALVGCIEAGETADFVVAGIASDTTVAELSRATRLIRSGAQLVVSNPDVTHPTPDGFAPEAGAIQAFLEASGGKPASVIGKPNPYLFRMALDLLGTSAARTLMIGDTPETDIKGALGVGMPSALVETGNPTAGAVDYPPTLQVEDLAELQAIMGR